MLTFVCRPHNPSGAMVELPAARPLVVDEAYFEYGGETALPLLGDDVIVVRTFSKAFGLASARVGYALADLEPRAELNERQQPAPISTLSAALALAGLEAGPPDVSATIAERERLADGLRGSGSSRSRRTRTSCSSRTRARRSSTRRCSGAGSRCGPRRARRITVHRPEPTTVCSRRSPRST